LGLNDNDWPERPERDPEAYTEEEIEKLLETAAGTFRGSQRIDDKKKHDRLLLWAFTPGCAMANCLFDAT